MGKTRDCKTSKLTVVALAFGLVALLTMSLCVIGCGSQSNSEADSAKKPSAITALTQEIHNQGAMTKKQAKAAAKIMKKVGLKGMTVDRVVENGKLDHYRGMIKGHQVNFTSENGKIFYVQITGLTCEETGWFKNWRGKLKYGTYQSMTQFDLYNTDEVRRGYIAKYDQKNDRVIPWSEL